VENLNDFDAEVIKKEVSEFQTMIMPESIFIYGCCKNSEYDEVA